MKHKISWTPLNRSLNFDENMVMQTQLGVFGLADPQNPVNRFKFHIMNTNFRVMKSMIKQLNQCSGVCAITVFSQYSIGLAFGDLFKPEKVKQLCELNLVGRIVNNLTEEDLPENLKSKCKSRFGNLVFPNGEVVEVDEEDKEVYEKAADLVGGVFVNQN